ncbi:MAG TPA: DUF3237 family protein [Thermoplasmata archaeon]|nr:DUF3237 family protein [Thermoplasmata archaeon]
MQLRPLYRARLEYPQQWGVTLEGERGQEDQMFLLAEGTVEGRLAGRLKGANYPRRRPDQTAVTDFRGVLETEDGAVVLFEYGGYGRAHTPEHDRVAGSHRRQWVATATHHSEDPRYRWLNDVVCVGTGEVGPRPGGPVKSGGGLSEGPSSALRLDVAELVWEPPETG